ncbi:GSU2403 family nucleotidyltransferase fold protein [Hoeflea alexandrii]|uniref:GSU2403 family nucleotidyltransferase fold protein n=1 Tax=Hoeflea alexandrii TaxID=288436 RepID=UPI002D1E419E|nr:GSU2403 family nucleotidyltransferase fold protein [Hoeflea alexandrii]
MTAERDGPTSFKAEKDRQQAAFIISTMAEDRPLDIWDAYEDAMARGPRWRERIGRSLDRMPDTRDILIACEAE